MKANTPMQSTIWLLLEKFTFIALSFVVTLALARHLMPALFGELNYLMANAAWDEYNYSLEWNGYLC
jgi:O-antigen/teichoic acid export membrane protein